jgi:hypothetical protein
MSAYVQSKSERGIANDGRCESVASQAPFDILGLLILESPLHCDTEVWSAEVRASLTFARPDKGISHFNLSTTKIALLITWSTPICMSYIVYRS